MKQSSTIRSPVQKSETIEEFLARGGEVKKIDPKVPVLRKPTKKAIHTDVRSALRGCMRRK